MAVSSRISAPAISWDPILAVGVILATWLALYLPVYIEFASGPWRRDENAHAPFIMAIAAGIAWSVLTSPDFNHAASPRSHLAGVLVAAAGLAACFLGRIGEATLLTSASQGILASGAALALFGFSGLGRLWFPLALTFYLIIWPPWALEAMTSPLKRFVSVVVSESLFAAGLPIAHSGAVISAGPYQLLVADACAGLNSMIALTSVGVVYLYAIRRRTVAANATVLLALAPIAVGANIARVATLVLITYWLGYDAGQSFLHETAGLVMFAVALGAVFLIDAVAARLWERRR